MNVLAALALRLALIRLRWLWFVVLVPLSIAIPSPVLGMAVKSSLVAQFARTVALEIIWVYGMA
jgi:hypothetical protein